MLFQRLFSFFRQLIAPNCELLCQLFFGKVIRQSLVQIGCFHFGQARDSLLFENGFFHGRIDMVQRIKSGFDNCIPLIYQSLQMFRRMNPISIFEVLRKPSLRRKCSKMDPLQENDIPRKQAILEQLHISFRNRLWIQQPSFQVSLKRNIRFHLVICIKFF